MEENKRQVAELEPLKLIDKAFEATLTIADNKDFSREQPVFVGIRYGEELDTCVGLTLDQVDEMIAKLMEISRNYQ